MYSYRRGAWGLSLLAIALLCTGCAAKKRYNKGVVWEEDGQYAKAILSYREAVDRRPNFAHAHYNMARCYEKLYVYDNAIKAYERAVEIAPDMLEAHWNLALVLEENGELERANGHWYQVLALCNSRHDADRVKNRLDKNLEKLAEKKQSKAAQ